MILRMQIQEKGELSETASRSSTTRSKRRFIGDDFDEKIRAAPEALIEDVCRYDKGWLGPNLSRQLKVRWLPYPTSR